MEKPEKLDGQDAYDLMNIYDYVVEKYEYEYNFSELWHWFVMKYEPDNGCYRTIEPLSVLLNEKNEIIKPILKNFQEEFGDNIKIWSEW